MPNKVLGRKPITLSDNMQEQTCIHCDGAGLLRDSGSKQTFCVRLCNGCNGHGVVLIEVKKTFHGEVTNVHKYGIRDGVPCES